MNTFIAIAIALSLAGSFSIPVGTVLIKGYKDERKRILSGSSDPYQLPRNEQVYEAPEAQKKYQSPSNR